MCKFSPQTFKHVERLQVTPRTASDLADLKPISASGKSLSENCALRFSTEGAYSLHIRGSVTNHSEEHLLIRIMWDLPRKITLRPLTQNRPAQPTRFSGTGLVNRPAHHEPSAVKFQISMSRDLEIASY